MPTLLDMVQAKITDDPQEVSNLVANMQNWGSYAFGIHREKRTFLIVGIILSGWLWIAWVDYFFVQLLKHGILTPNGIAICIGCIMAIGAACFMLRILYYEYKVQLFSSQVLSALTKLANPYGQPETIAKKVDKAIEANWRKE